MVSSHHLLPVEVVAANVAVVVARLEARGLGVELVPEEAL